MQRQKTAMPREEIERQIWGGETCDQVCRFELRIGHLTCSQVKGQVKGQVYDQVYNRSGIRFFSQVWNQAAEDIDG